MIVEEHETFARAVVALARQHGMNNVKMSFRFNWRGRDKPADSYEEFEAHWSEGRHGEKGEIQLSSRGSKTIKETTP